jgi:hypothetical protein
MSAGDARSLSLITPAEVVRRAQERHEAPLIGTCADEALAFAATLERLSGTMRVGDKSFDVEQRDMPPTPTCRDACISAAERTGYTVERRYEATPNMNYEREWWTFSVEAPPPPPSLWQRLFSK